MVLLFESFSDFQLLQAVLLSLLFIKLGNAQFVDIETHLQESTETFKDSLYKDSRDIICLTCIHTK